MTSFNKTLLEIFFAILLQTLSTHNLRGETWKEADILQSLWKKTDMVASPPFPTPFLGPERSLWVSNIPVGRGPTWKPLPEKGCERHKQAEKGTSRLRKAPSMFSRSWKVQLWGLLSPNAFRIKAVISCPELLSSNHLSFQGCSSLGADS